MNLLLWKTRAAAAAAVVLIGLSVASAVAIGINVLAVQDARANAPTSQPSGSAAPPAWRTLKPLLRRSAANSDVAIGEFLNGRLGELGFSALSVDTVSLRPLGGGLQLAEVRVEGRSDAASIAAVANWAAVNREVVRLKSISLSTTADGSGQGTLVLLMVIG